LVRGTVVVAWATVVVDRGSVTSGSVVVVSGGIVVVVAGGSTQFDGGGEPAEFRFIAK
jgi:hypothetical protein